jgi:hypothetical protein
MSQTKLMQGSTGRDGSHIEVDYTPHTLEEPIKKSRYRTDSGSFFCRHVPSERRYCFFIIRFAGVFPRIFIGIICCIFLN